MYLFWRDGNMAVYQFHRILEIKREYAGKHLIKGNTYRIEVGTVIHLAIHSSGLFR
ncbi:MAG: hypothetical protein WCH01_02240 [Methylococcaceae bacterium]